ncbi:MAG: alpha/beta hydrolase [Candidatus Binataceae bacterium]|nr:alpha/beta hydrolase [Candidatus Binataceae bacterium]
MSEQIIGPASHYFYSQRLKLHYVDWGNEDRPLAILVHGGRDHCRNWDWVAMELRGHFHLIAPDLRGHGDSDWSIGGSYSMIDYVLDLAQLMNAAASGPAILIGHSLGGAVVLQYAGAFPERVRAVVAIEGLGPPPSMIVEKTAHERMRTWIEEMQALARRKGREYPTLDAALHRMREANPHLSVEQARHLTVHGVRRNENGAFSWKFDNYVHATSPYLFNLKDASEIWSQIGSPCLLIRGDESQWAGDPEGDGRLAFFRAAESIVIRGAGHWVHHDRLAEFIRAVRGFLKVQAP